MDSFSTSSSRPSVAATDPVTDLMGFTLMWSAGSSEDRASVVNPYTSAITRKRAVRTNVPFVKHNSLTKLPKYLNFIVSGPLL